MTFTTYPRVRKATSKQQYDRETWATPTQVVTAYDMVGAGQITTDPISFGVVYETPPFFAYGVELQTGETLVAGDFPYCMCGVSAWTTTEIADGSRDIPYYLGASIWINVSSTKPYKLRFQLSFEGLAMRNVEYFRGTNG